MGGCCVYAVGCMLLYALSNEGRFLPQDAEGECSLTGEHDRARYHGEDTDGTGEESNRKAKRNALLNPGGDEHSLLRNGATTPVT